MSGHICDSGNFDRTLCAEPCGSMHSYCDTCGERQDPCAHEALEVGATEVQWGIDLGATGVTRASSRAVAAQWVKSYVDHPQILRGDPMPSLVRRDVITSPWRPTNTTSDAGGGLSAAEEEEAHG